MVTLGLGVIGYGIAGYNALVENRVLKNDFVRSLTGVSVVAAFYVLMFLGLHWIIGYSFSIVSIPLLIYLAILTHTPSHWARRLLDKLTLPNWEQPYRERIAHLGHDIITAPDPQKALVIAEKEFANIVQAARKDEIQAMVDREIRKIFRHRVFQNDSILAHSKLFELKIVQRELEIFVQERNLASRALSTRNRADALRGLLIRYLNERLCPNPGGIPSKPPSREWVEYLILHKKYVEGQNRNDIEKQIEKLGLLVTGGAYSRHLKSGRDMLATIIWQAEIQMQEDYDKVG